MHIIEREMLSSACTCSVAALLLCIDLVAVNVYVKYFTWLCLNEKYLFTDVNGIVTAVVRVLLKPLYKWEIRQFCLTSSVLCWTERKCLNVGCSSCLYLVVCDWLKKCVVELLSAVHTREPLLLQKPCCVLQNCYMMFISKLQLIWWVLYFMLPSAKWMQLSSASGCR